MAGTTSDRTDPALDIVDPETGMQEKYLVLTEEERSQGFVRPLRVDYQHVGIAGPSHPLRDLTPEEQDRYGHAGYVKYEEIEESLSGRVTLAGRFWTQEDLDRVGRGCGAVTTMSLPIAETYAREPTFYGATYCVGCKRHLPVGRDGEFIWRVDGTRVGT